MFCPDCGAEYEEGVAVCLDCEVALVDESGEVGETEFTPLVESTEVSFFSLLTSRLEQADIPWFVQGEASMGVLPRDGRSSGKPEGQVAVIYVAKSKVDAAWALVESLDPAMARTD